VRRITPFALALAALGALAASPLDAQAAPPAVLAALYAATVPRAAAAGATIQVSVTVTNTGTELWNASGANPVNLAYHWLSVSGAVLVWEGTRTPLGGDVAPGTARALNAAVALPSAGGAYQLRLHLVKEGVAWFPQQSDAYLLNALVPFAAQFGAVASRTYVAGLAHTQNVTVTNTGSAAWNASGANPVALSYHWHDDSGGTVVWDGVRTPLAADVAPGASATLAVRIVAPAAGTGYTLSLDLVREGLAWFGTPLRSVISVEAPRYSGRFEVAPATGAFMGETKAIPVTVTNTGNVAWNAAPPNPVHLAYHLFDGQGRAAVWDGPRTPLGSDLAPGASRTLNLSFTAPLPLGSYTVAVEAVREGFAWFSDLGVPAGSTRLNVTSGFSAGYGASTTPALATIGATLRLSVEVVNYGPRTLSPAGPNPVSLAYHIHDAAGATVVWDGQRAALPREIGPGQSQAVSIQVALPNSTGDYLVSWDLVQEGLAWFSQLGIPMKVEPVTVQPGVTFYGKGFGHGVGLSQWGAQGLATGAGSAPLTGEQIVARYYAGTDLRPIDPNSENRVIRVLLSAPSSQGRFNCSGTGYMDTWLANLVSPGGFRVLSEPANTEVGRASANVTWQVAARSGRLEVWNNGNSPPTKVWEGTDPVVVVPADPTKPTTLREKGVYRGNIRFTNLGNTLRTTNVLSYDEYVRGVVPLEMPVNWHLEAYKAQALAARTYAYASYRGGASDYDVSDDQTDQCYGGVRLLNGRAVERALTDAAVAATAGKLITYQGKAIRAYFSSSSGGHTKSEGCWKRSATTCVAGLPYLQPVADPADLRAASPGPNPRASWTATFTGAQIRQAVLNLRGVDIGLLVSVDVSNQSPPSVGHVVSVKIGGTNASVELPAEAFLRDQLLLRSTMVRLGAF